MKSVRSLSADNLPRPKPFTFYPPRHNRVVTAIVKMALRLNIRRKLNVTDIDVSQEDLERLRGLKGKRCLVTPSHSGGFEPHIIMYLSKLLRDDYSYVAAMELFARSPIHRWVLQRLGVYSIIRGTIDRQSFTTTRQILAEGKRWLVVFPEGEAVGQNSIVIPFQPGVIQLAFKAYEDAAQTEQAPSLYCIPMAIRYFYLHDMHGEIDASLDRLESKLAISAVAPAGSRYDRLRKVAEAVLAANERVHHLRPDEHSSMNERIQNLKERVLSQLEGQLGIKPVAGQSPLDRVRAAFNAVDRIGEHEPAASAYETQLAAERQQAAREFYHDLWRALRFVAIYDGYVSESMTVERFLDVLGLLELEVLQRRRIWGPRKACVQVAEPIDLKDHFSSYRADKRGTVQRVAATVEHSVRRMLESLETECQAVRLST
jgi:1-acyl-sn-glycerol-3-phosphate acyltransferase